MSRRKLDGDLARQLREDCERRRSIEAEIVKLEAAHAARVAKLRLAARYLSDKRLAHKYGLGISSLRAVANGRTYRQPEQQRPS